MTRFLIRRESIFDAVTSFQEWQWNAGAFEQCSWPASFRYKSNKWTCNGNTDWFEVSAFSRPTLTITTARRSQFMGPSIRCLRLNFEENWTGATRDQHVWGEHSSWAMFMNHIAEALYSNVSLKFGSAQNIMFFGDFNSENTMSSNLYLPHYRA